MLKHYWLILLVTICLKVWDNTSGNSSGEHLCLFGLLLNIFTLRSIDECFFFVWSTYAHLLICGLFIEERIFVFLWLHKGSMYLLNHCRTSLFSCWKVRQKMWSSSEEFAIDGSTWNMYYNWVFSTYYLQIFNYSFSCVRISNT